MGNHVKRSVEQMKEVSVTKTTKPAIPAGETVIDDLEMEIYRQEVKSYVKKKELLASSMARVYAIIYGQCSDGIRAKLGAMDNHEKLADDADPIGLLKNIKTVMANFQTSRKPVQSIMNCKKTLLTYKQGREQPIPDYHKKFKGLVDVIEYNGGSIGAEPGLYAACLREAGSTNEPVSKEEHEAATSKARDETIAYLFLFGADKFRFGKLHEDIENAYTQGDDKYPSDLTEAYKLLTNWKQHVNTRNRGSEHGGYDVSFANVGDDTDNDEMNNTE